MGLNPKSTLSHMRAQRITHSLAHFITKDMSPVAIMEGEGFREFASVMEPVYIVPSQKMMSGVLQKLYNEGKVFKLSEAD